MKAVLMSIKPKYCELIVSGKKTIEVRKTRPKIDIPFKCYIYCTKPKERFSLGGGIYAFSDMLYRADGLMKIGSGFEQAFVKTTIFNGKVISEFVCDEIIEAQKGNYGVLHYIDTKLVTTALLRYAKGKTIYGWHISDLVIYDEPKELNKFTKEGDCQAGPKCKKCPYFEKGNEVAGLEDDCVAPFDTTEHIPITRPPQSWCYVEV